MQVFTGTVSRATMREEDLVPVFMEVLEVYAPVEAQRIKDLIEDELRVSYECLVSDCEDRYVWRSDAVAYILFEDIWDAMQDIAPDGHYFGAHPGDGCDYGFWPVEEVHDA